MDRIGFKALERKSLPATAWITLNCFAFIMLKRPDQLLHGFSLICYYFFCFASFIASDGATTSNGNGTDWFLLSYNRRLAFALTSAPYSPTGYERLGSESDRIKMALVASSQCTNSGYGITSANRPGILTIFSTLRFVLTWDRYSIFPGKLHTVERIQNRSGILSFFSTVR